MSKNKKDRQAEEKAMESCTPTTQIRSGVSHTEMKLVSRTKPVDKSMMLKGTDADPLTTSGKYQKDEKTEKEMDEIRQKSLYNEHNKARVGQQSVFRGAQQSLEQQGQLSEGNGCQDNGAAGGGVRQKMSADGNAGEGHQERPEEADRKKQGLSAGKFRADFG